MITFLLIAIVFYLWIISEQLDEMRERDQPTRSHAEWTHGVWNGRP